MSNTATAAKFTAGQTVSARSVCDYDCIFSAVVVSRTAKRVTLSLNRGKVVTVKVQTNEDGSEFCFPQGRYSMAPIFRA
jgi:hypothetical protein